MRTAARVTIACFNAAGQGLFVAFIEPLIGLFTAPHPQTPCNCDRCSCDIMGMTRV